MENPGEGVLAVAYLGGGTRAEKLVMVPVDGRTVVFREVTDNCILGEGV